MTEASGMSALRTRIFEIIEVGKEGDHASRAYNFVNMFSIITVKDVSHAKTVSMDRAAPAAVSGVRRRSGRSVSRAFRPRRPAYAAACRHVPAG